MNSIEGFLTKIKTELDKNKSFPFWNLLTELESLKFTNEIKGKIEDSVHIEGKVYLAEGAVIKSGSRIEGNVFIGRNSVIGPNAFLRKNVVIANDCHISNSEIKNSIILAHSNVPHYSYVGDSVIGENVNLGAGTKIANLRFDDKTISVKLNGEKINSERRKLGACIGHNTKIGINASINCGIFISNNSKILPAELVKENI
ncbi:MAG: hypothetical protein Q7S92_06620 [Candidatus Diapherotrites archaeon]|nr:hypothetical protein [Candidatus Diapherotrites archaeon]